MRCFGDKVNEFLVYTAPSDLAHHSRGWLHEPIKENQKNNVNNNIIN